MKSHFVVIILAFLYPSTFLMAQSIPPFEIDGSVTIQELNDTTVHTVLDKDEVIIRESGQNVYVGIRGRNFTTASVFYFENDKMFILHASAALGEVEYRFNQGQWTTESKKFEWIYRDPDVWGDDIHDDGVLSTTEFYERFKWTANTVSMGSYREMEFLMSKKKFSDTNGLIITYIRADGEARNINLVNNSNFTISTELLQKLYYGETIQKVNGINRRDSEK